VFQDLAALSESQNHNGLDYHQPVKENPGYYQPVCQEARGDTVEEPLEPDHFLQMTVARSSVRNVVTISPNLNPVMDQVGGHLFFEEKVLMMIKPHPSNPSACFLPTQNSSSSKFQRH
jgi:hypothetical protein